MFDTSLFAQPDGPVGAFSKTQEYGRFRCYRHLQGDNLFVAEDATTGRRQFFSTPAELCEWVEGQYAVLPAFRRGRPYEWEPRYR